MDDERIYCVYKRTSPVGKVYIGMTGVGMDMRLKRKYRGCHHIQNALDKYGKENFIHEVLKDGLTREEAFDYEEEMISFYKSNNREFGYNLNRKGSGGTKPTTHAYKPRDNNWVDKRKLPKSEETKKKMSEGIKLARENTDSKYKNIDFSFLKEIALLGCEIARESNKQPVIQYDLKMNELKRFESIKFASESTGIRADMIGKVCRNIRKQSGGFIWRYGEK